jgi:hypothetical protein
MEQALGKTGLIGLKSGPLFPLNLRLLFQNFSFGTASIKSASKNRLFFRRLHGFPG